MLNPSLSTPQLWLTKRLGWEFVRINAGTSTPGFSIDDDDEVSWDRDPQFDGWLGEFIRSYGRPKLVVSVLSLTMWW